MDKDNECYGYIYCIENIVNNHKYIGQTIRDVKTRVAEHIKFAKYEYTQNRALYQAIRKYGEENFKSYIIDSAQNQNELDEKETYWIDYNNTFLGKGYNMTAGGQTEKKDHSNIEVSNKLSKIFGGREFLIFDLNGNYIKSMVSQTACAEELGCTVKSIHKVLKGQRTQVMNHIFIFKDEFSEELLNEKMGSRRKFHTFIVFDEDNNFIGQWESEIQCNKDTDISRNYIHKCLINNNIHKGKCSQKCDYKIYYLENCSKNLLQKVYEKRRDYKYE